MLKTVSSITNALGALNYQGTWNASTNTPTLVSSVGTKGDYYVVSVAGSTSLNGISNWGVGDWCAFNGAAWERVEGGADLNGVNLSVSGVATFAAGTVGAPAITTSGDTNTGIYFPAADTIAFTEAGVESMRIDSGGRVLINKTSNNGTALVQMTSPASTDIILAQIGTNGGSAMAFLNSGGAAQVGNIVVDVSSTAYNTSSDYRLKEAIAPVTGALAKVALLKPVTYKWKINGSDGEGFIAHELAEVCPHAVSGAKDAVDANGNPKYQGIDVSFLVATLTAAIQEQQALITSITARIVALEAK
jgi:hypothetical protein